MLNNKNILLVAPILLLLELHLIISQLIYISVPLINLYIIIWIKKSKKKWTYAALPAVHASSVICFTVLLTNKAFIQFLIVSSTLFIYWYFDLLPKLKIKSSNSIILSYGNIVLYGNFLAFFFSSTFIYGLMTYLSLSLFILLPLLFIIIIILSHNIIESVNLVYHSNNKFTHKPKSNNSFLLTLMSLALIELGWTIALLPFNYLTLGLLLSLSNYVIIGIIQHYLKNDLKKRSIQLYLSVGLAGIIFITITTRWM